MTTTILKHEFSGLYLYNGQWIDDLPEDLTPEFLGKMRDIKHGGSNSEGIIDTAYYSPEDFEKEEWGDDDDTTDDYKEVEISLTGIYVKYWNFRPDYSLPGHEAGYQYSYEKFDSEEEATEFLKNMDDDYRGELKS